MELSDAELDQIRMALSTHMDATRRVQERHMDGVDVSGELERCGKLLWRVTSECVKRQDERRKKAAQS